MQRIAEDLEGRDDGKAKEAPKSKLQTRRGASRYLRRCSSCYTDAGTGYCGSEGRHGYRVHVHFALLFFATGQSCRALRAVHALWTGLASECRARRGNAACPWTVAAGSSYKGMLYTAALCLLSGQAPPPSLAGTGTLTNAIKRTAAHLLYSQKHKTSVQPGRERQNLPKASSLASLSFSALYLIQHLIKHPCPPILLNLGGAQKTLPRGSAVHTVDAATGPRPQHSVASAAPDGWR
ncbi:hypothetical protein ACSS6W_007465 [Trichoderma asperelloides]